MKKFSWCKRHLINNLGLCCGHLKSSLSDGGKIAFHYIYLEQYFLGIGYQKIALCESCIEKLKIPDVGCVFVNNKMKNLVLSEKNFDEKDSVGDLPSLDCLRGLDQGLSSICPKCLEELYGEYVEIELGKFENLSRIDLSV